MPEPLVICDNLVKIYKVADLEVVALQGLDLEVSPGEMIAIVGVSGSGKTTLLNILSGLDLPSAGKCLVDGHDLTRLSQAQRINYERFTVGHVWQQSGRNLLPELSIQANVELPQVLGGVDPASRARRARELLELVGLEGMGNKRPDRLSGGEQQRAAIAVALANHPKPPVGTDHYSRHTRRGDCRCRGPHYSHPRWPYQYRDHTPRSAAGDCKRTYALYQCHHWLAQRDASRIGADRPRWPAPTSKG